MAPITNGTKKDLTVCIVGAGLGGVAGSIAMAKNGVKVILLEQAPELGEIGAGIQMTPNVSRFLIKWGVADVIGKNLVEFEELNMRKQDGTKVGYTHMIPEVRNDVGWPWWVVHRAHLHDGLVAVAQKQGVEIRVDSRVDRIEYDVAPGQKAKVFTAKGDVVEADLIIGSDGVKSVVRNSLFPGQKTDPIQPTPNCAYRAVVPYSEVRKDPQAAELIEKLTMEVWMADHKYIISYPISGGEVFNMVLSHHCTTPMSEWDSEDCVKTLRETYKDFDPRVVKILEMIPEGSVKRWPLLVTGPLKTWLSPQRNVVLMGDAAHSMVNHMAQGAATAMEDGAFLGVVLGEVVKGSVSLAEALEIYEKVRQPKAYAKQQVSFINGAIWHLPDGAEADARDAAMSPELSGKQYLRSPNLYGDPVTVLGTYAYDAEVDAQDAVRAHLEYKGQEEIGVAGVTKKLADVYLNWFLPDGGAKSHAVKGNAKENAEDAARLQVAVEGGGKGYQAEGKL
ncbi:hypothetical protein YB2330_006486 [Saitoella coloradoensis]